MVLTALPLACTISPAASGQSPQPSTQANIDGMCLEKLSNWEGDFYEEIGQGLGLGYRRKPSDEVFVLTHDADRDEACKAAKGHTTIATLHLPPVPTDQWVAVSYDCHDPTDRIVKGDAVIGVFKKSNDRVVPQPAERAWLVDRTTKRFQSVPDVACKSFE